MTNYKLLIEYDGSNFFGWQKQKDLPTVQRSLEDALEKIFGKAVKLSYAARTDAGVHARGQVANFLSEKKIPQEKLKKALNSLLPEEIKIKKIKIVPPSFDSRKDASSKIYQYNVAFEKVIFERKYFHVMKKKPNLDEVRKRAKELVGKHDFSKFSITSDKRENKNCKIEFIKVTERDKKMKITIKGDRFLYKMVRRIVGYLLTGRIFTVPAKGLTLLKVEYEKS